MIILPARSLDSNLCRIALDMKLKHLKTFHEVPEPRVYADIGHNTKLFHGSFSISHICMRGAALVSAAHTSILPLVSHAFLCNPQYRYTVGFCGINLKIRYELD
jgi:hypothetical protein